MAFKLDFRNIFMSLLFSIIFITIVSLLLSQYMDFQTIQSGKAFLLIFIGVFISVLFWAGYDKKIERKEIWTLFFVALVLAGTFYALRTFIPEIFSSLPTKTQDLFSAVIK